jgi:hypothetical protein
LIIFNVVSTLPYSTLIFNSLTISDRHKCATTSPYCHLPSYEIWISLKLRFEGWCPTTLLVDLSSTEVDNIFFISILILIQTCSFHTVYWHLVYASENGTGCPYPYPRVWVGYGCFLSSMGGCGWVRIYIYYIMALRAPGRLTTSTKLGLGLRTPENCLESTFRCFYD